MTEPQQQQQDDYQRVDGAGNRICHLWAQFSCTYCTETSVDSRTTDREAVLGRKRVLAIGGLNTPVPLAKSANFPTKDREVSWRKSQKSHSNAEIIARENANWVASVLFPTILSS